MRLRKNRTEDTRKDDATEQESVGRRNLLRYSGIAAAGAAAAAVAGAVSAEPAGAANGDKLELGLNGGQNAASAPTGMYYNNGGPLVPGEFGIGVIDQSTTFGVFDLTPAIGGVANVANFTTGVQGVGTGGCPGVTGTSVGGSGVYARGTSGGTGVQGESDTAPGVDGHSNSSVGVLGTSSSSADAGVMGTAFGTGPGVRAQGKGVLASSGVGAGHAAALDVRGRAAFTRSGLLTIPAGATNAFTNLVPGGLLATSRVLATIQENKGTVTVRAAVPITAAGPNKGKIQIILTGAVPTSPAGGLKVAWFVFG